MNEKFEVMSNDYEGDRLVQLTLKREEFIALWLLCKDEKRWRSHQIALFVREGLERRGYLEPIKPPFAPEEAAKEEKETEKADFYRDTPIPITGISTRLYNALMRGGFRTIGDLLDELKGKNGSYAPFCHVRTLGESSRAELYAFLRKSEIING
jgi:hypothetical protein